MPQYLNRQVLTSSVDPNQMMFPTHQAVSRHINGQKMDLFKYSTRVREIKEPIQLRYTIFDAFHLFGIMIKG